MRALPRSLLLVPPLVCAALLACPERSASPAQPEADPLVAALDASRAGHAALDGELASGEAALAALPVDARGPGVDAAAFTLAAVRGAEEHLGATLAELQPGTLTQRQVAVRQELALRLAHELQRAHALVPAGSAVAQQEALRTALGRAAGAAVALPPLLGTLLTRVREAQPLAGGVVLADYAEAHEVRLVPGVPAAWTALVQPGPVHAQVDCGARPAVLSLQRGMDGADAGRVVAPAVDRVAYDALVADVLARIAVHTPEWENPNTQDGTGPEGEPCTLTLGHVELARGAEQLLRPEQLDALRVRAVQLDAAVTQAHAELEHLRGLARQDPRLPQAAALDELERALTRTRNAASVVPGVLGRGSLLAEAAERLETEATATTSGLRRLQSAVAARGGALQGLATQLAASNEALAGVVGTLREATGSDGGR